MINILKTIPVVWVLTIWYFCVVCPAEPWVGLSTVIVMSVCYDCQLKEWVFLYAIFWQKACW